VHRIRVVGFAVALVTTWLSPVSAAPRVANGLIAFDRYTQQPDGTTSKSDVWIMNPDGSDAHALTSNAAEDAWPDWSPNGRWIAFQSDRTGREQIYVMRADGSGLHRLTRDRWRDMWPRWSPNGRRIAFVSSGPGGVGVFSVSRRGTERRLIARGLALDDAFDWSPDGTRIAFDSPRLSSSYDLYSVRIDGRGRRRLLRTTSNEYYPEWSPTGKAMAFVSDRTTQGGSCEPNTPSCDTDLYVMRPDGSHVRDVVPGPFEAFCEAWSPDGTMMVFNGDNPPATTGYGSFNWDIFEVRADGSGMQDLTPSPSDLDFCPSWQPSSAA
jgi:Tol biopolymer transport system component